MNHVAVPQLQYQHLRVHRAAAKQSKHTMFLAACGTVEGVGLGIGKAAHTCAREPSSCAQSHHATWCPWQRPSPGSVSRPCSPAAAFTVNTGDRACRQHTSTVHTYSLKGYCEPSPEPTTGDRGG